METFLSIEIPLLAGMLLPVWIPLIAVGAGAVLDRIRVRPVSPAEAVVTSVKARAAEARTRGHHHRTPDLIGGPQTALAA